MDNRGLIQKYKVNYPLTSEEWNGRLPKDKPSRAKPWYQLSVIRMNSTYLEVFDKYFLHKGVLTAFFSFFFLLFLGALLGMFAIMLDRYSGFSSSKNDIFGLLIAMAIFSPAIYLSGILVKREAFQYTHYPIRFNRKTRMVHVFRMNGTVLSRSWDDIFFTLCNLGEDTWEVRGLILDHNEVVQEVFPLTFNNSRRNPHLLEQWEFIRRYMEEPDELPYLAGQVAYVMDIAERRESFIEGWKNLSLSLGFLVIVFLFPLFVFTAIGRTIAMHTSRIPHWPDNVEAKCQVEPDDPYLRDGDHLATLEETFEAEDRWERG